MITVGLWFCQAFRKKTRAMLNPILPGTCTYQPLGGFKGACGTKKKNRWEAQWWPGPGATMQDLWKNQDGPWGSNEVSYRVSVSKSWYYFLPGHMEDLVSMVRVCRDRKRRCPRKAQAQLSNQFHSRRSQKRKHIAWLCGWNPATAKGSLEI